MTALPLLLLLLLASPAASSYHTVALTRTVVPVHAGGSGGGSGPPVLASLAASAGASTSSEALVGCAYAAVTTAQVTLFGGKARSQTFALILDTASAVTAVVSTSCGTRICAHISPRFNPLGLAKGAAVSAAYTSGGYTGFEYGLNVSVGTTPPVAVRLAGMATVSAAGGVAVGGAPCRGGAGWAHQGVLGVGPPGLAKPPLNGWLAQARPAPGAPGSSSCLFVVLLLFC